MVKLYLRFMRLVEVLCLNLSGFIITECRVITVHRAAAHVALTVNLIAFNAESGTLVRTTHVFLPASEAGQA